MSHTYIRDLKEFDWIEGTYALRYPRCTEGRLNAKLSDRTGSLPIVMFGAPADLQNLADGSFVYVHSRVSSYRGETQVKIDSAQADKLTPCDAPECLDEFMRISERPIEDMLAELDAAIEQIGNEELRAAIASLIGPDGKHRARYSRSPAGASRHHAYLHGLIEHSLEVRKLAMALAAAFDNPSVNSDLIGAGAIVHDLGKSFELAFKGVAIEYTPVGNLLGHIYMGAHMVQEACAAQKVDPTLKNQIVHVILAHHGSYQHGSPVFPAMREAWLVHEADRISAGEAYRQDAEAGAPSGSQFVYSRLLEHQVAVTKQPEADKVV